MSAFCASINMHIVFRILPESRLYKNKNAVFSMRFFFMFNALQLFYLFFQGCKHKMMEYTKIFLFQSGFGQFYGEVRAREEYFNTMMLGIGK
jgi:hypothetical protein